MSSMKYYILVGWCWCVISVNGLQLANETQFPNAIGSILELPQKAAVVIRNYIDQGLQNYLGLTTPPTPVNPSNPNAIENSILGNYLLWFGPHTETPIDNKDNQAGGKTTRKPKATTPTPTVDPNRFIFTSPPKTNPPVQIQMQTLTQNGNQNAPISTNNNKNFGVRNPPAQLPPNPEVVNPEDGEDEVYWIPTTKRSSVVIPIESSTGPTTTTDSAPDEDDVVSTTETQPAASETTPEDEDENESAKRLNI